jgi:hypothetical protein
MNSSLNERYDLSELRKRASSYDGPLLVATALAQWRPEGWRLSLSEQFQEDTRLISRNTYDRSDQSVTLSAGSKNNKPMRRVRVEVVYCGSATDAMEALIDSLDYNQLAQLQPGPAGPWIASFVQTEPAPPALSFMLSNLLVTISSIGTIAEPVVPWAEQAVLFMQVLQTRGA